MSCTSVLSLAVQLPPPPPPPLLLLLLLLLLLMMMLEGLWMLSPMRDSNDSSWDREMSCDGLSLLVLSQLVLDCDPRTGVYNAHRSYRLQRQATGFTCFALSVNSFSGVLMFATRGVSRVLYTSAVRAVRH